jgi:hypothetical protein
VPQPRFYKQQHVENSAGSAVAVGEGVNGFELVMLRSENHERVEGAAAVNEMLPIRQVLGDACSPLRPCE